MSQRSDKNIWDSGSANGSFESLDSSWKDPQYTFICCPETIEQLNEKDMLQLPMLSFTALLCIHQKVCPSINQITRRTGSNFEHCWSDLSFTRWQSESPYWAPMLIQMKYQVKLLDHYFVAAPKHKLIPSVIGDMKFAKSKDLTNDPVTSSGATYIGIRSTKYLESSAFAHFQDMMRVRFLPEFATSFQTDKHEEKKLMIVTV